MMFDYLGVRFELEKAVSEMRISWNDYENALLMLNWFVGENDGKST
jgi:hypothetical protein